MPRLALVTFGIGIVGSLASYRIALASHWSVGLIAYCIFGVVVLAALAKVSPKAATIIMAVFIGYRLMLKGALLFAT